MTFAATSTAISTTMWYAIRATGVVALVLLTGTMVLGVLTAGRTASPTWPGFARAELHKRISLLSMVFLGLHVLTSVADTYVHIGWAAAVVPFASSYRPVWTGLGAVGVDLIVAVGISSALRQRISARTWRAVHWLAYGSWPVAMAHSLGMGTDAAARWFDGTAAVCALAVAGAVGWRIADLRRSRERARLTGAVTRVVIPHWAADRRSGSSATPDRRRQGPRSASSGRTYSRTTATAGRATGPTATNLLEKDRS